MALPRGRRHPKMPAHSPVDRNQTTLRFQNFLFSPPGRPCEASTSFSKNRWRPKGACSKMLIFSIDLLGVDAGHAPVAYSSIAVWAPTTQLRFLKLFVRPLRRRGLPSLGCDERPLRRRGLPSFDSASGELIWDLSGSICRSQNALSTPTQSTL